jgi:2-isopropylmalate synthase
MDPHTVGVPESKLVLGKHSGRHALHKRAEDLGFELGKEELDVLYHRFTSLADRKKGVGNDEIVALLHEVVGAKAAAAND